MYTYYGMRLMFAKRAEACSETCARGVIPVSIYNARAPVNSISRFLMERNN